MTMTLLSTIIALSLISIGANAIPLCNSDRPGGESHRTLYVTQNSLSGTVEDNKWTNVLCCVYTHVEITNLNDWNGWMRLYDGSWESLDGDKLPQMAQDAYDEICDMSMGAQDCMNQKSCIENAMKTSTIAPTNKITP